MRSAEKRFYVYEHLRSDTGTIFYVGKGTRKRCTVRSNYHRNEFWQRTERKAGGFRVRMIASDVDEELAFLVEKERISQLRAIGVRLCNLTDGGDGTAGWVKTTEWREKVGAAHRGKIISEETRKKLSAAKTGSRHTDAAKAKMSASRLGIKNTLGHKHSDETRQKMSAAHAGNKSRTGQKRSESERAKHSASMTGKSQQIITCPHCGISGGNAMKRWHFDNCKEKK
jgi:hypothetical protein